MEVKPIIERLTFILNIENTFCKSHKVHYCHGNLFVLKLKSDVTLTGGDYGVKTVLKFTFIHIYFLLKLVE